MQKSGEVMRSFSLRANNAFKTGIFDGAITISIWSPNFEARVKMKRLRLFLFLPLKMMFRSIILGFTLSSAFPLSSSQSFSIGMILVL